MRWTYDTSVDALYLSLTDTAPTAQVVLEDGTVLDIDRDGRLVGIEIISARVGGWNPASVLQNYPVSPADARAVVLVTRQLDVLKSPPSQRPAERLQRSVTDESELALVSPDLSRLGGGR